MTRKLQIQDEDSPAGRLIRYHYGCCNAFACAVELLVAAVAARLFLGIDLSIWFAIGWMVFRWALATFAKAALLHRLSVEADRAMHTARRTFYGIMQLEREARDSVRQGRNWV